MAAKTEAGAKPRQFKKGQLLEVHDARKGFFLAKAAEDFSEADEWYPITLDQDYLAGMANDWADGESVPARKGISRIEPRSPLRTREV